MAGAAYLRAVRAALRTTTGTQDFTVSGAGTCVGYMVHISRGVTDGTLVSHIGMSKGWCDGTNSLCLVTSSEDNVADSNTAAKVSSTQVGIVILSGAGGYAVRVAHSAMITDGVRINVQATDGVAYLCDVTMLFGSAAQMRVGSFDMPNGSANDTLDVTAPGFEPTFGEFIFGGGIDNSEPPLSPPGAGVKTSYGLAVNLFSGVSQRCVAYSHADNVATSAPSQELSDIQVAESLVGATTAPFTIDWTVGINSWLSTGFRAKNLLGGNPGAIGYCVVKLGASRATLTTEDSPTAVSGTTTVTPGFTPWSAICYSTIFTGIGQSATTLAGQFGWGFAAQQGEEFSLSQHEQDAQATMNNGCLADDDAVNVLAAAGTAGLQAAASFTPTTFVLTFSVVLGTARKQFILVLEKDINSGTFTATQSSRTAAFQEKQSFLGTASATQSSRTAAFQAKQSFVGTFAATQSSRTAAATGSLVFQGAFAATQSSPSALVAASLVFQGAFVAAQSSRTAAFEARVPFTATFAATQSSRTATGTALLVFRGDFDATQGSRTAAFTAAIPYIGTFSATQSSPSATFASSLVFQSAFTGSQSSPSAAATGSLVFQGAFSSAQSSPTATFSALELFLGAFDGAQSSRTATFFGVSGDVLVGNFTATQSSPTAAFQGGLSFLATVAATQAPRVAAMAAALVFRGDFAATQGSPTAAFTGGLSFLGSLGATQGSPTAAFTAGLFFQGAFAGAQGTRAGALTGLERFLATFTGTQGSRTAAFAGEAALGAITGTFAGVQSSRMASFVALVPVAGTRSCLDGSRQIVTELVGAYASRTNLIGERKVCD